MALEDELLEARRERDEARAEVARQRKGAAELAERVKAERARVRGAWLRMARRALKDLQVEYDEAVHRAAADPSREADGELRALSRLRKRWNKELGEEGPEA